jgi:hypothetical protein
MLLLLLLRGYCCSQGLAQAPADHHRHWDCRQLALLLPPSQPGLLVVLLLLMPWMLLLPLHL